MNARTERKPPEKKSENKEGISVKPVESLTDSIMGTLTSILKVQDLRGAQAVLVEAQRKKDDGDKKGAQELALQVFERLKKIGVETDELPEKGVVSKMADQGEYGELAKMVKKEQKKIDVKGEGGDWKEVAEEAGEAGKELGKLNTKKTRLSKEKTDSNAKLVAKLPKEAATKARENALKIAKTEADLSRQVMGNVERLVGELGVEMDVKGLKKLRNKMNKEWEGLGKELKISGRAELSISDVKVTRERLSEVWQKMMDEGDDLMEKVGKKRKDNQVSSSRQASNVEKLIRNFVSKKGEAATIIARSKQLAEVLGGVEAKLEQGLSFEQVCQDLKPHEISVVWKWLDGMNKKPGEPGYDVAIASLNEEILKDPEALGVLVRFMENVDMGYVQARWGEAENEMSARGVRIPERKAGSYADAGSPMIYDGDQPHFGRPESRMTGEQKRGREHLADMSGDAEYVKMWMQAKSADDYLAMQLEQKSSYRAEMMNVNFDALMEDSSIPDDFKEYLDVQSFKSGMVARLKEKYRNNKKAKDKFQTLWLQQMLYEQRMIAYEGVFQGATQDARLTRYNTLMSIMDIGTELKGFARFKAQMFGAIDKQQNSFVNEEALVEMAGLYVGQGPDYRLEHMFKTQRENLYVINGGGARESIGDISVLDVVHKLKMRVEDPTERSKLGLTGDVSRHYGTMLERYTDDTKRTEARETIFFSLMDDIGVKTDKLTTDQRDWLFGRYQGYLDEGINYLWTHKQLHQAIGNASLEPGKYELPQGLPEMLYKADPLLVMDYFRIYNVGGASKDAWVIGDSGMRDQATMSPKDFANHLLFPETTTQGAPGIREAFFGGKGSEVDEHVKWFGETMEEAMFHNGYYDKNHPVTMSTKIGDESNAMSGTRRPDAEIIDILKGEKPPDGMVEAIEWGIPKNPGIFAEIVVDPKLVAKLTGDKLSAEQKWDVFIKRMGEDYLNATAANAKRMDHFTKYGLDTHFKWYAAQLAWQATPTNNTKLVEALQPSQAVNAGITSLLAMNAFKYVEWANEQLGKKVLGGKSTERVKKDNNRIQFSPEYGMMGKGDTEWPGLASEKLENDSGMFDPIQKTSVNDASNVGSLQDELALQGVLESFQHAGMISEDQYSDVVKNHIYKSYFWADKKGIPTNLWNLVTLESLFEYMGNVWFQIPGHVLREAWSETTKKEMETLWKYFIS